MPELAPEELAWLEGFYRHFPDILALIAEVRRLRQRVSELEAPGQAESIVEKFGYRIPADLPRLPDCES